MEFTVEFKTSVKDYGLFDNVQKADGMDLIDLVKEETGMISHPNTIYNNSCNYNLKSTCITLNIKGKYIDLMLKHPSFRHFSNIDVIVPSGWFGQFVYDKVTIENYSSAYYWHPKSPNMFQYISWWFRHDVLGKEKPIYRYIVTNECNYEKVINEWFEAGMPNYWGITEERHTELVLTEIICEEDRIKEQKRLEEIEHLELTKKQTIDLDYFADELSLMVGKLKNIQKEYNK